MYIAALKQVAFHDSQFILCPKQAILANFLIGYFTTKRSEQCVGKASMVTARADHNGDIPSV